MKRFAAFLMFAAVAAAGPAAKPGDDRLATLADAVTKGAAGDAMAAAVAAGGDNDAAPGTVEWHQQSGLALLGYARILRAQLRFDESKQAARVAVNVLADGLGKYGKNASTSARAEVDDEIAEAYEDLIGNNATALQFYNGALGEDPGDHKATAALKRAKDLADSLDRAAKHGGGHS